MRISFDFSGMTAEEYFQYLVRVWGDQAETVARNIVSEMSFVYPRRKDNPEMFDFACNLYSLSFGLPAHNVSEFLA